MFDPVFGLPIPPVDAVAPTFVTHAASTIFGVFALIALVFALVQWRRTGSPIYLLILLGGGLTTVAEPLIDVMGACWHPKFGQPIVFEFMGRYMPVWIVMVYFAFFGAQGTLCYHQMQKGITMRQVRYLAILPMVADMLIEEIALPTGLYMYVGNQPLILLKSVPFWWLPCNSLGMMLGIALVYLLAPHLKGLKALLLLVVLPIADVIGYVAIGLPSFIVINTAGVPWWLMQLGGIATYALAFVLLEFIARLVATDSPWRVGATERPLNAVFGRAAAA
jgi:hypothetical protein